jgi:hypothetical protein
MNASPEGVAAYLTENAASCKAHSRHKKTGLVAGFFMLCWSLLASARSLRLTGLR